MGDVAVAAAQSTSLESFVNDPTPEKHLIYAIRYINKLAQNIAGGKSLDDLHSALRMCVSGSKIILRMQSVHLNMSVTTILRR